jgi:hypothetical protein
VTVSLLEADAAFHARDTFYTSRKPFRGKTRPPRRRNLLEARAIHPVAALVADLLHPSYLCDLDLFKEQPMRSYSEDSAPQPCVIEAPAGSAETGVQWEDYVADSTQKLESIAEMSAQGEAVDRESRDWMLAQVDYIVEAVGNDAIEMSEDMRSNMLQLLLAIANLNEQIRHESQAQ